MKNWFKKLITSVLVLTASIGLTGCFGSKDKDKDSSKETYTFVNYDNSYYVNEQFSIVGTKLKITDGDGNVKEVDVTANMIKTMPDMTTSGKKKVVIVYNGVEYHFFITVEETPINLMLDKLNAFLEDYESNKNSLVVADVTTDLQAKYFDKTADLNEYQSLMLISQMFDADQLTNTVYDGLFDALVEGSFNIGADQVVSVEDLIAKLDTVKALENFKQSVSTFNPYTYAIDQILSESDEYYINLITDDICDSCYVESSYAKLQIKNVVSTYYYKLKNFEHFEARDAFEDLLNAVNTYSSDEVVKTLTSKLENLELSELAHILSDVAYANVLEEYKVMTVSNYEEYENWHNDDDIILETGAVATNLIKDYANSYKDLIKAVEDAVLNIGDVVEEKCYDNAVDTLLSVVKAYADYNDAQLKITNVLKANEWIIVEAAEDDDYCYPVTDGYFVGYTGCIEYVPFYDDDIEYYASTRDYVNDIYNMVKEDGVVATIKEYEVVELLLDSVIGLDDDYRTSIINGAYELLEAEDVNVYRTLVESLLIREDSEYISYVTELIKMNSGVESTAGELAIEEVVTTYFNKIKNVEYFNLKDMFVDVLTVVNEHTTDDIIRSATDSLTSLSFEEIAHIPSDLIYIYNVNNNEIVLEEDLRYVTYGEELYVTSEEATNLIERYACNQQSLIKNIEDFCIELHNIFESVDEDKETKAQDLILTTVDNFTKYYEEEIAILEACEQNQWVIWDTNAEGSVDYEGDFDECNDYKEIFTAIYDVLDVAFNLKDDFEGTINGLIERHKEEIVAYAMMAVDYIGGLDSEDELYTEIETLITNTVDDYITDTLDVDVLTSEIDRLINEYAHEDFVTISKASHMLVLSLMYDEEIDYNEVFKDVELPHQIESVDYNGLMDKLFNIETYDMFTPSDIIVEYITDEDGNIIGEVLTLDVSVNFDAMIASITGDVQFTLTLDFEGIEFDDGLVEDSESWIL